MPLLGHEAGIEQYPEVLRDGRPAHLEMSRNRVDRAVGLKEEIEHPATRGMANCPKDIRLAIGSHHHVANIRKQTLTSSPKWALSSWTRGSIKYARMTQLEEDVPVHQSMGR